MSTAGQFEGNSAYRMSLSATYTSQLEGKTVRCIKHAHYGDLEIKFTDGTRVRLTASGQPPTIFVNDVSHLPERPLLQRLFKIDRA